jgi:HAE1 family hydrophobic/amphiphilic exporter-1
VGQATIFGSKDYAMRIWLKPDRLAAYNLSAQEVLAAIKEQNLEAAPGKFGEGSKESFEYVIKYKGKLNKNEDYENIILKSNIDGQRLGSGILPVLNLAHFSYTADAKVDKGPSTGILIYQTAGSNANDILTEVNRIMERVNKTLPKGVQTFIPYSSKEFLDASIDKVERTLIRSFHSRFHCSIYSSCRSSFYINSRYSSSGRNPWHLLLYAVVWFYDQPTHAFCIDTGNWIRRWMMPS